ncbi:MAG: hypothetical protein GTN76_09880 [Candidatus Aenigmarchaeota archaeon]|nr:hypothetical protein [Candidatus Aenigmarchaeota archaeon]
MKLRLVEYARKINELAPKRTVQLIASSLKECGRPLARSRITLLGLSYREDVKEMRMSPALDVASILVKRGAKVTVYDPYYQPSEIDSLDVSVQAASTLQSALTDVHCAAIMVAHREFKSLRASDLAAYMGKQRAVVDGPGILDPVEVGKVGLAYRGIGKGVK